MNRELETTLILSEGRAYSSVYDLETEIENLIRTAPNNAKKVRQGVLQSLEVFGLRLFSCLFLGP